LACFFTPSYSHSTNDGDLELEELDLDESEDVEQEFLELEADLEMDSQVEDEEYQFQSPAVDLSNSTDTLGNVSGTTDTNSSVPVTSTPAPTLTPAIIWKPKHRGPNDGPLFGTIPANLTKPHITPHIYGGEVRYRRSNDTNGCPCREQVPEKFRYDTELRDRKKSQKKCSCAKKGKKGKKSGLPPIVAALYPKRSSGKNKKKACKKPAAKKVAKIAPEYRAARKHKKKAPCPPSKPKNVTVTPEFYPPRKHHKHRGKVVTKLSSSATAA